MDRIAIKVRVYVFFFIMRYLKNCQKLLKWAKLSCQASWNGVGQVGIEGDKSEQSETNDNEVL